MYCLTNKGTCILKRLTIAEPENWYLGNKYSHLNQGTEL